ncbi:MAG: hypothetical protein LC744_01260 [Chloroflexi bacterium]|nr:hypothetical protein [Chloroflexota bacterium]
MPVTDALRRLDELRLRAQGNTRLEVSYLAIRGTLEAMQGRFDVARGLIGQAKAFGKDGLLPVLGSGVASSSGEIELLAGDFEGAERELLPACEELERIGELGFLSSLTPLLIDAILRQGRIEQALKLSDRWRSNRLTVAEDADAHVGWRRVRGKLLAHTGDAEGGERLAREAIAMAATTDFLGLQARAWADLGEVLRLADHRTEAAGAFTEAVRRHERKGNAVEAARERAHLAEHAMG